MLSTFSFNFNLRCYKEGVERLATALDGFPAPPFTAGTGGQCSPRHGMPFSSTNEGPESPRHRMPFKSTNEGSNRVMTWRALLMDSSRHVIGCHLT